MGLGLVFNNFAFAKSGVPHLWKCIAGNCIDGKGTETYINAACAACKYVGQFKNGNWHGQGTYTDKSRGRKYVGQFKNGRKHGQGTYTDKYRKYVGEFKDGGITGQGTETYTHGVILPL